MPDCVPHALVVVDHRIGDALDVYYGGRDDLHMLKLRSRSLAAWTGGAQANLSEPA